MIHGKVDTDDLIKQAESSADKWWFVERDDEGNADRKVQAGLVFAFCAFVNEVKRHNDLLEASIDVAVTGK